MAVVVLDASVVIGHLSDRDAHHEAAAAALLERADDELYLPATAFAEALVEPERQRASERARSLIGSLGVVVDPIGEATAVQAARLRARHPSLRLPDALVIAHADVLGADEVLTTDTRWRRLSPRVRIVG